MWRFHLDKLFNYINLLQDETNISTSESPVAEKTPSTLLLIDLQTPATSVFSQIPATSASVYSPTEDDPLTSEWKPLEKLNSFLESRDISPVRHPMKTQWEEASERTKRRHTQSKTSG